MVSTRNALRLVAWPSTAWHYAPDVYGLGPQNDTALSQSAALRTMFAAKNGASAAANRILYTKNRLWTQFNKMVTVA